MGRSVIVASGSVHVEYATFDACDEEDSQDDFQWQLDDFAGLICKAFPSATSCNKWIDREDHAVAENSFAYFGASEYCGLVSMWVTPKDEDYYSNPGWSGLRDRWIDSIGKKFSKVASQCFGQSLVCAGRFSNGEAIFNANGANNPGATGLGFSSKEGWL